MKIHTVGVTGECSDRTERAVISYLSEERAKDHVIKATERAKEWVEERQSVYSDEPPKGWNEYDPEMRMFCTGTYYYYVTTVIADYGY